MNDKILVSVFLFITLSCSLFGSDGLSRTLSELVQETTKAKSVLASSEVDQSMTLSDFI